MSEIHAPKKSKAGRKPGRANPLPVTLMLSRLTKDAVTAAAAACSPPKSANQWIRDAIYAALTKGAVGKNTELG